MKKLLFTLLLTLPFSMLFRYQTFQAAVFPGWCQSQMFNSLEMSPIGLFLATYPKELIEAYALK